MQVLPNNNTITCRANNTRQVHQSQNHNNITHTLHTMPIEGTSQTAYTTYGTHIIRPLILLVIMVVVSAAMSGCNSAGTITFTEPATLAPQPQRTANVSTLPSSQTIQYRAGNITATKPLYNNYAAFATQYLKQILKHNQTQPANQQQTKTAAKHTTIPITTKDSTCIITGQLDIQSASSLTQPTQLAVTVKLNLRIKDNNNHTIKQVWLTRTAQTAPTDNNNTIKAIITQQINSFAHNLSAGYIIRKIKLATGHSPYARKAAKLASQGKLKQALKLLRQAIDAHPWDHASIYNAGLCSEALGQYQQAYNYYARAWHIKQLNDYKNALLRIKPLLNLRSF